MHPGGQVGPNLRFPRGESWVRPFDIPKGNCYGARRKVLQTEATKANESASGYEMTADFRCPRLKKAGLSRRMHLGIVASVVDHLGNIGAPVERRLDRC